MLDEVDVRTSSGDERLFSLSKDRGLIAFDELNAGREPRADSLVGYKTFGPGDIVMNRMQAWNGVFGLSNDRGIVSPDYVVLRPKVNADPRYLTYLFRSALYAGIFEVRSTGVGRGFLRLQRDELRSSPLPAPSRTGQTLIADFLDRETERIDGVVAAKRRMIELLEEERTARINAAVRWQIEDVREERLKYYIERVIDTEHKTVHFVDNGQFPVIRTSDVRQGEVLVDQARTTDEDGYREWTVRGRPVGGDVLLSREAPVGEAAVVPPGVSLCLGQRMVLIRVGRELDPQFLVISLYSARTTQFIDLVSQGSTVRHLNMADIPNIPLWVPGILHQQEIVGVVKDATRRIDTVRRGITTQLALLDEYRQALITAAVTGRLDEATLRGEKPIEETMEVPA